MRAITLSQQAIIWAGCFEKASPSDIKVPFFGSVGKHIHLSVTDIISIFAIFAIIEDLICQATNIALLKFLQQNCILDLFHQYSK